MTLTSRLLAPGLIGLLLSGCAPSPGFEPFSPRPEATAEFADIAYADWTEAEPDYRFFPGDEIDVVVPTAPELNRSLRVGPDGRVSLALATTPIMAADRSVPELEAAISQAYAATLVRPEAQVVLKQAAPIRIYVGGEVENPGEFEMPGDIDALQAIVKAGGFTPGARRFEVVVIRRGPDGRPMMKTVDLLHAVTNPDAVDAVPLRRFDIVYVPRTRIAEVGLFTRQYLTDAFPFTSGFSYVLADRIVGRRD
jgi:polysaccharide export outer membrane protein